MSQLTEQDQLRIKQAIVNGDYTDFNAALANQNFGLATEILQLTSEEEANNLSRTFTLSQREYIHNEIERDYNQACNDGNVDLLKKVVHIATLFRSRNVLYSHLDERLIQMAKKNQIDMMQTMLNFTYSYATGPFGFLTGSTSEGVSVFQYAVKTGKIEIIKMIISTVKRVEGKNLHTSNSDPQLLEYLFVHSTRDGNLNNVFQLAVQHGHQEVFDYLLEQVPPSVLVDLPKSYNANGRSVFLLAKDASLKGHDCAMMMEKIRALDPKLIEFQEKIDDELKQFKLVVKELLSFNPEIALDDEQQQEIATLAKALMTCKQNLMRTHGNQIANWPQRMICFKEACIDAIRKAEKTFIDDKGVWNQWIRPIINKLIVIFNSLLTLCGVPTNHQPNVFPNEISLSRKKQFTQVTSKVVSNVNDIEKANNKYQEDESSLPKQPK